MRNRDLDAMFGIDRPSDNLQPVNAAPIPGANPPLSTPERGRVVTFPLNAATSRLLPTAQPLLRAVTPSPRVWTVNLSPVYLKSIGSNTNGYVSDVAKTGAPGLRMQFGAAGVSYQWAGIYPIQGGSFAVAADSLTVDVLATDLSNAYTDAIVPSVAGWVTEAASPQTTAALFLPSGSFPGGTTGLTRLSQWCRAVWAYAGDGGLIEVTFKMAPAGALQTVRVASGTRVPVPNIALQYNATAVGVGASASVTEEISFV